MAQKLVAIDSVRPLSDEEIRKKMAAEFVRKAEPDVCLCNDHFEEIQEKAYKEGVADTKREYNIKD